MKFKYASLIALLLLSTLLAAESPAQAVAASPSFDGSDQPHPASQLLAQGVPSSVQPVQLASAPETALGIKDKDLLFAPPDGGGVPLGTPVKETSLLLAALVIIYGIIIRMKNPSNSLKGKENYENKK